MSEPWRSPLHFGDPTPGFTCPTRANPKFHYHTLAGRFVVLSFLGDANSDAARRVLGFIHSNKEKLDHQHLCFFGVVTKRPEIEGPIHLPHGMEMFFDDDQAISRLYKAASDDGFQPYTLVVDALQRVLVSIPLDDPATHNKQLGEVLTRLPRLANNPVNEALHAPVLILPRVFEPSLCRELIGHYQQQGGKASGYMREVDGKTIPVLNTSFKRRKDFRFETGDEFETLRIKVNQRIFHRLLPQIQKVFQFHATRMERHVVSCYSSEDNGFFSAHRDNTTPGTKHRKFACTINLNAEDYDGGDLRFPEFGPRTYRAPTGGACIFSCSLLHEATPVTSGDRYAFLPFFYDDEGGRIRAENEGTIVDDVLHE